MPVDRVQEQYLRKGVEDNKEWSIFMARSKSCSPLKGFFSSLATRTYALVAKREYKAAADVLCEPSGQGFLGEEEEEEGGRYCRA